ncbi:MAG: tetratricopeptide repeat protein [Candidatus Ozemobacteraceae bacterium]
MSSLTEEKALIAQAMDAFREGKLANAEKLFRDFLSSYAKSDLADNASYNLAKICMKRGEKQKALEWLDRVLTQYPDSDAAYFAKDERVELLREMGIGPKETDDELYMKGKKILAQGNLHEAEKVFLEVVEKYPDSDYVDNAHYNLGLIYRKMGMLDRVRQHVDIIMNSYPESDSALYARDLLDENE